MLAEIHNVNVGDYVVSYHFPDRPKELTGEHACYVIGEVAAILEPGDVGNPHPSCNAYELHVSLEVWKGKTERPSEGNEVVYPPVNGTKRLLGGVCDGVHKL